MSRSARETIEEFWRVQDSGDYTQLVPLFAEDAVVVDPIWGTYEGRDAIAEFMALMVKEVGGRQTHFTVEEISGGGDTAWAQWTMHSPAGDVAGCGLYRVRDGLLTYYRDYIQAPSAEADADSEET